MKNEIDNKFLTWAVYVGAPVISLIIITEILTDPVNLPKYFVLVSLGISLLIVIATTKIKEIFVGYKAITAFTAIFVLFCLNSILWSDSPLSQNLYGVLGRNSGFLTYLSLSAFLLATLTFRNIKEFEKLLIGFFITGIVNVIYCAWVVAFGDFIGWNNEYGNILGFLGNPNFIGAFLGMYSSFLLVLIFRRETRLQLRIGLSVLLLLTLFEVQASHAIQGKVVAGIGFSAVVFVYLRVALKKYILSKVFLFFTSIFGLLSLAGALQIGPLTRFIYKNSVSLRGSYWDAGIEMGLRFPFTGVGMDSYIDWYRQLRNSNAATSMPGPNIVTNAAHNVPIDIFAYGGFPLLLTYLAILLLGLITSYRILRDLKQFDYVAVSIVVLWLGYQIQSIVSINQIGLAIWGWVLTGALFSYQRLLVNQNKSNDEISKMTSKRKIKSSSQIFGSSLIGGVGIILGAMIALPPYNADLKWRSALVSTSLEKIESALQPSVFNPANSSKYLQAYTIFVDSKLPDQARKYTLDFLEYNPRSFEAWKCLYSLANSSDEEKARALRMMKILDPNNPDVTSTQ